MANIIDAITAILELEKELKAMISSVKEAIQNEKDRKRRKRLAVAFKKRDLEAIRKILFDVS